MCTSTVDFHHLDRCHAWHTKGKKFFTKISRSQRGAKREKTFYNNLSTEFQVLKQTVPTYVDSKIIDGIIYLTMEMIDGVLANSEHIQKIIATSQKITTVKYS